MLFGLAWWVWLLIYGSVVGFGVLLDRIVWTIMAIICLIFFMSLFDNRSSEQRHADVEKIRVEMHRDILQEALDNRDRYVREHRGY
jgi:uncharacterized membrane protein